MTVVICMLRGVNLVGHNRIKMDALRALCESLGLRDAQTCVQSGNVVFRTNARDLARLAKRIEDAIERGFGFRPAVIIRTPSDLRAVIARNPFAKRKDTHASKLLVMFLASEPGAEARTQALAIKAAPEELKMHGREVYIYFLNGQGQTKLPLAKIEKTLKTSWTGRNWNTVSKLLEIAEKLESS
jgi:uncharacterized protein (DUF1697 family)